MDFKNGNLTGLANKLRAMKVGDSFLVQCVDKRDVRMRLASNIAAFKRSNGNGWRHYATSNDAKGVRVTRAPDTI